MSEFNEILTRLGRIEGKQDAALENQLRLDKTIAKHDVRLQNVEKNQSRVLGIGAGILALWSAVAGYIKFGA